MQNNYDLAAMVKKNRRYVMIALPAILLQLFIFKLFYPFASYFFTDSFGYLYAAVSNTDAATWPIGYSKFLRVFNTFIHTDTGIVCFQFFFLQAAGLYFLFTLLHFFRPSRIVSNILFVFLVFNPLFLYLSNCISSDALFIGMSLLWLAQLIWIIRQPSVSRVWAHAVLLTLLFTFRYHAIYYPLVAIIAILLSSSGVRQKLTAITLPLVLLAGFIFYTANTIKEISGTRKFSPFSGWQMANNALYMIDGMHTKDADNSVPPRYAGLDSVVKKYFDTAKDRKNLFDGQLPGMYYLWSQQGPLAAYLNQQRKKDSSISYYKYWANLSPLYSEYGKWLIRSHPGAYAKYWLLPNTMRYILPPLEFVGNYNSGEDTVDAVAKYWFHYKTNRVRAASKGIQGLILSGYAPLNLITNLFFFLIVLLLITTRSAWKADPLFLRYMGVIVALWVFHFGFSIFTAPVVLRYQLFLLIVILSFSLLTVEYLVRSEKALKNIKPVI